MFGAGTSLRRVPRWRRATPCWTRSSSWRSTCRRRPARRCCGAPRSCSSTRATCTARPQVRLLSLDALLIPSDQHTNRHIADTTRCWHTSTMPKNGLCNRAALSSHVMHAAEVLWRQLRIGRCAAWCGTESKAGGAIEAGCLTHQRVHAQAADASHTGAGSEATAVLVCRPKRERARVCGGASEGGNGRDAAPGGRKLRVLGRPRGLPHPAEHRPQVRGIALKKCFIVSPDSCHAWRHVRASLSCKP